MPEYDRISRYYDLVEQKLIDYEADIEALDSVLRSAGARTVLDVACGTGTHLLGLSRLGYECVGMDIEPEMIEVAREKAWRGSQAIEFFVGDMRDYRLNRVFDAVCALYAFTSLVNEADLRSGLVSARRAVRDGGLLYFNLLNANAGYGSAAGSENDLKSVHVDKASSVTGAMCYIDTIMTTPIRLVRINQVSRRGNVQDWTSVCLIDEGNGVDIVANTRQLRYHCLDSIEDELSRAGFDIQCVTYKDVQGEKRSDMYVLANAKA